MNSGNIQVTAQSLNTGGLSPVHWVSRFERLSRALGIVALVISGVVLLGGYVLGISGLQNLAPNLSKMMPNTALGLFLSAVSLFLYTIGSKKHEVYSKGWIQRLLASIVIFLGVATIAEYLLGINLGIDELLFRDPSPGATYPGRPSPQTSLAFVLVGASLLLLGDKRLWVLWIGQVLGLIVGLIAIVAMVGYVYASVPFYGLTAYTGMAIHTALSFLAISCGIIFAKSDRGLASVFTNESEGGQMVRRLLPAIILLPVVLGILSGWGERSGLFSTAFGRALDASLYIVLLGVELWLLALFMERSDVARREATQALHRYRQRLEQTVAERTAEFTRANEKLTLEIEEHRKTGEGLVLRATILDNAREAIFLINPNGDFAYANEAAIKTYAYSRDEFLSMNLNDLLRPEEAPLIAGWLEEVMKTGQMELETIHLRKDKSWMPVRVRHSLIKTLHGHFIVAVMHDMTDEFKLRLLLEEMPGILWTTDSRYILMASRGKVLEMAGLESGKEVGISFAGYLEKNGFGTEVLAAHQRALTGVSSAFEIENKKSGRTFYGWAAPLTDAQGRITGVISIAVDASEYTKHR